MSENVKNFIDNLEAGKNADAGEAFKSALRDKMGDALDARRQELAASLFNQKAPEAEPISDPKPEVADVGTFTQDGHFAELKNTELMRERLQLANEMRDYIGKFYSVDYVRKNILKQNAREIEEIDNQIKKEIDDGIISAPTADVSDTI